MYWKLVGNKGLHYRDITLKFPYTMPANHQQTKVGTPQKIALPGLWEPRRMAKLLLLSPSLLLDPYICIYIYIYIHPYETPATPT